MNWLFGKGWCCVCFWFHCSAMRQGCLKYMEYSRWFYGVVVRLLMMIRNSFSRVWYSYMFINNATESCGSNFVVVWRWTFCYHGFYRWTGEQLSSLKHMKAEFLYLPSFLLVPPQYHSNIPSMNFQFINFRFSWFSKQFMNIECNITPFITKFIQVIKYFFRVWHWLCSFLSIIIW